MLELLPGVISLSCQAKQQSSGFVLQLCLPLRKGRKWQSGKLRDSTQAPDSHFPWLSPFSQPPHHLWLCLSGSSAHNSIALPGKFTALKSSVQRARGVGWGGQGDSLGPVTLQEHLPVTPASKVLHFINMNAKTGSTTRGVFSHKTAKSPHCPCLVLPDEEGSGQSMHTDCLKSPLDHCLWFFTEVETEQRIGGRQRSHWLNAQPMKPRQVTEKPLNHCSNRF